MIRVLMMVYLAAAIAAGVTSFGASQAVTANFQHAHGLLVHSMEAWKR